MKKWTIIIATGILSFIVWQLTFARPSFDPDKIAQAETHMWQAYYSGDKIQLGLELIAFLRNQHGLSFFEAKEVGELLTHSAMKFRYTKNNYETVTLPSLTEAYKRIKQSTGGAFDPEDAARAELAWWVARRTPGQNSPEQVGKRIAELYSLLYGGYNPSFLTAGILRAEAASLRDSEGKSADWVRVETLLKKSYLELKKAI